MIIKIGKLRFSTCILSFFVGVVGTLCFSHVLGAMNDIIFQRKTAILHQDLTVQAENMVRSGVVKQPVRRATMDIMCRTFNGALFEIMRMVLTYLIFFPRDELSTQIILVFDAENEKDHITASVLETAYKQLGVKVFFEEPPPPETLTSTFRDEGFSRTMWSNFYSDLYSNADYIGMIDSDTEFSFRPSTSHHLLLDWKKPVIHGIYVPNRDYSSVRYMIGRDGVGEFMYVFPFVIKREHFALMRKHIVLTTGHKTFDKSRLVGK